MAGDPGGKSREDLLAQQAAFFESYFRKGAEFTRELIEETQRLRARLAELEEKLSIERDRDLEERFEQIERENNDLAALYVAQSQLHSTLDVGEVLQVVTEVLLNFVGADRFAILALDGDRLAPLTVHGLADSEVPERGFARGQFPALARGPVVGAGVGAAKVAEPPVWTVALRGRDEPFGVIAIWSYLPQKRELAPVDQQIFELLATSGGLALEAARVASEARLRLPVDQARSPYRSFCEVLRG